MITKPGDDQYCQKAGDLFTGLSYSYIITHAHRSLAISVGRSTFDEICLMSSRTATRSWPWSRRRYGRQPSLSTTPDRPRTNKHLYAGRHGHSVSGPSRDERDQCLLTAPKTVKRKEWLSGRRRWPGAVFECITASGAASTRRWRRTDHIHDALVKRYHDKICNLSQLAAFYYEIFQDCLCILFALTLEKPRNSVNLY